MCRTLCPTGLLSILLTDEQWASFPANISFSDPFRMTTWSCGWIGCPPINFSRDSRLSNCSVQLRRAAILGALPHLAISSSALGHELQNGHQSEAILWIAHNLPDCLFEALNDRWRSLRFLPRKSIPTFARLMFLQQTRRGNHNPLGVSRDTSSSKRFCTNTISSTRMNRCTHLRVSSRM
jgi:hypothetical protein